MTSGGDPAGLPNAATAGYPGYYAVDPLTGQPVTAPPPAVPPVVQSGPSWAGRGTELPRWYGGAGPVAPAVGMPAPVYPDAGPGAGSYPPPAALPVYPMYPGYAMPFLPLGPERPGQAVGAGVLDAGEGLVELRVGLGFVVFGLLDIGRIGGELGHGGLLRGVAG